MAGCWRMGCDSGMHGMGEEMALANGNGRARGSAAARPLGPVASHSSTGAEQLVGSSYLPAHTRSACSCPVPCPSSEMPQMLICHWHSLAQMSRWGQGGIRSMLGLAFLLDSLGRALGPPSYTASPDVWAVKENGPLSSLHFPPDLLLHSPA